MKVAVTGGRLFGAEVDEFGDYTARSLRERRVLQQALDAFLAFFARPGDLLLAHGGANGADALAGAWAGERGVPVTEFKADWKAYGKAAGPVRNRQLLETWRPDFLVAFEGGAGTQNCKQTARLLRIPVLEVVA